MAFSEFVAIGFHHLDSLESTELLYSIPVALTGAEHSALFPLPSTASQDINVCPMGMMFPNGGSQVRTTFPELSEAIWSPHILISVWFTSFVRYDWLQLRCGASLSVNIQRLTYKMLLD